MRTQSFLVIALALALAACDDQSAFVSQTDLIQDKTSSAVSANPIATGNLQLQGDPCIELLITQWLSGDGIPAPVLEIATDLRPQGIQVNKGPGASYILRATGDAISELYTRGQSELNLLFDSGSHKLRGTLLTVFFNGETLEMKIDGNAEMEFDDQVMQLNVPVAEATIRTSKAFYTLAYGEISFALPAHPDGKLEMEVSTTLTLCVEEIQ